MGVGKTLIIAVVIFGVGILGVLTGAVLVSGASGVFADPTPVSTQSPWWHDGYTEPWWSWDVPTTEPLIPDEPYDPSLKPPCLIGCD